MMTFLLFLILAIPPAVVALGWRRVWPLPRIVEWAVVTALAGSAIVAPSPWAALPVLAGLLVLVRRGWPTATAATISPILAVGALFLTPTRSMLQKRAELEYAGAFGKANIASLKSELRRQAELVGSIFETSGRYDVALVYDDGYHSYNSTTITMVPSDRSYHLWAMQPRTDVEMWVCDIASADGIPTCPATTLAPSAIPAPHIFSAKWVRDSSSTWAPWVERFTGLDPAKFAADSVLLGAGVRMTVAPSGWRAERDAYNWTCVIGSGTLAPSGVEPGGIICAAQNITPPVDSGGHQH